VVHDGPAGINPELNGVALNWASVLHLARVRCRRLQDNVGSQDLHPRHEGKEGLLFGVLDCKLLKALLAPAALP